jgi:hypothetical protein
VLVLDLDLDLVILSQLRVRWPAVSQFPIWCALLTFDVARLRGPR